MERVSCQFEEIPVLAAAPPVAAEPAPAAAGIDAEVARYAVLYPDRAARIRAAGGLQADLDFGGRVPRSSLACCAPPIRPSPGQRDGRAIPAGATASSQRGQ
jgi:hypothetical protein